MAVHEKAYTASVLTETPYDAWHQITNNYEIANSNPKALDGDRRIEYNSRIRVGDLR